MPDGLHRTYEQHAAVIRETSFDLVYFELGGRGPGETLHYFAAGIFQRKSETILRCFYVICGPDKSVVMRIVGGDEYCHRNDQRDRDAKKGITVQCFHEKIEFSLRISM